MPQTRDVNAFINNLRHIYLCRLIFLRFREAIKFCSSCWSDSLQVLVLSLLPSGAAAGTEPGGTCCPHPRASWSWRSSIKMAEGVSYQGAFQERPLWGSEWPWLMKREDLQRSWPQELLPFDQYLLLQGHACKFRSQEAEAGRWRVWGHLGL